jgi:hypothetical protein
VSQGATHFSDFCTSAGYCLWAGSVQNARAACTTVCMLHCRWCGRHPVVSAFPSANTQPFGITGSYLDRKESPKMEELGFDLVKELDDFLPQCDVVSLHLGGEPLCMLRIATAGLRPGPGAR